MLPTLAETLTAEFGKGFDASNLRYMRLFYQAFPIRDALRHELNWTHYRTLLRGENDQARQWYMNETASQGWTTRALERQIGTLYYERLLASSDRATVEQDAVINLSPLQQNPREFVRAPVMLEFLGLPGTGQLLEADLEQALLDKDASVVRYSVLHENEQLFASKYKLVLPSEEELRAKLDRERASLAERREHPTSNT